MRVLSQEVCGRLVPGCHPGVSQDLVCCQSLAGVNIQHLPDQILGQARDSQPVSRVNVVLPLPNPAQYILWRVLRTRGEWCLASQHCEQQDS